MGKSPYIKEERRPNNEEFTVEEKNIVNQAMISSGQKTFVSHHSINKVSLIKNFFN